MPSFSSSEISSMISSKKYKVKKGDTLSVLADKLQDAFPCTKSANKNSLMDKIYNMNKSAFGGSKDLLFEGKDLDLKFICEYRNNLKFDKSKKEYTFTDEDRLVFAIKGANSFWDDFINIDKTIGESMKKIFNSTSGSILPKSTPIPIISNSSSNSKKLMEEIKKGLSGTTITTNQIVEGFFKLMEHSPTSSQVNDLAKQLEKENGACRCSGNCPCVVLKDTIEQLSDKIFEETYLKIPLSSSDKTNLEKGFYKPTKLDKLIFSIDSKHFWSRLYQDSGDSDINTEARKGAGLTMDKLEGDKIFVATKLGISKFSLSFSSGIKDTIPDEGKKRIKLLYLYCNHLGSNFSNIEITSTFRTSERQVEIMINDYFEKGIWGLYGYSEQIYKDIMNDTSLTLEEKNKKAYDELLKNVNSQKNVDVSPGFPHCNPNICVVDTKTYDSNVDKAIKDFRKTGTLITSSSLHFGEKGEKANHIILTGLRPS